MYWRRQILLWLMGSSLTIPITRAQPPTSPFQKIATQLIAEGLDSTYIYRIFSDPRLQIIPNVIPLNLRPREIPEVYQGFLTEAQIVDGRQFLGVFRATLGELLEGTGISEEIAVALLKVESDLGRRSGKYPICATFATLTLLRDSLHWIEKIDTSEGWTRERLRQRAQRRAPWAYRELKQFLAFSEIQGWDPLEIRGSWAGAFGWQQFLPSSYLRCAQDGDGDQKVDPFSLPDAVASMTRYLLEAGWGKSRQSQRRALMQYNPSAAYVDCILTYAQKLQDAPLQPILSPDSTESQR